MTRHERWMVFLTMVITGITGIYACFAYKQWRAMLVTNQQTKQALHISERAYINTNSPTFDVSTKVLTIQINNDGHIPSGEFVNVTHEATIDCPSPSPMCRPNLKDAVEYHWKRHQVLSNPPGKGLFTLAIPIPKFSASKYTPQGATQAVLVAGRIKYDDGFPDDGLPEWSFCFQSVYHGVLQSLFWVPCDIHIIPAMEKLDGYPNNEQEN
jgi:hypothetical protein